MDIDNELNSAIIARISELLEERGWKNYRLAVEAGLSTRSVNYIMRGERKKLSIHTVKKICDGFEISLEKFFAGDVFKPLSPE